MMMKTCIGLFFIATLQEEIVYKPLNEEPLPDFFPAEERKESSNSSSSSSSSEDQEEEEETNAGEELEHETTIQHNFVSIIVDLCLFRNLYRCSVDTMLIFLLYF